MDLSVGDAILLLMLNAIFLLFVYAACPIMRHYETYSTDNSSIARVNGSRSPFLGFNFSRSDYFRSN